MNAPSLPPLPSFRILGNGHFTSVIHSEGGGFARCRGWALNDWNGESMGERGGWILYIRDMQTGTLSALGADACCLRSTELGAESNQAAIRYSLPELTVEILVSVDPERDVETREITLINHAQTTRQLEITAFLPVALNDPAAHAAHPAFSKLFVQTEAISEMNLLLAQRRPRGHGELSPCLIAQFLGEGTLRWETDRAKFLGRGRGIKAPISLESSLTQTVGNVLDPAFALQQSVHLKPHGKAKFQLRLGFATDRDTAISLNETASTAPPLIHSQLPPSQLLLAQNLAGAMLYRLPCIAAPLKIRNLAIGHPGLVWSFGLPTDRPFGLLITDSQAEVDWMAAAQSYWNALGLEIPLLILAKTKLSIPAGVHVRQLSEVSSADRNALIATAALVCGNGCLWTLAPIRLEAVPHVALRRPESSRSLPKQPLLLDNGLGGFTEDGREYVIRLQNRSGRLDLPPVPWINVLANPNFGCLISEVGAGPTWARNSRERRLTPWSNDPVLDPHEEAIYLYEDSEKMLWSPLPGPIPSLGDYEVRHSFGVARFLHECNELAQETTVFVHATLPVKFTRVVITNQTNRSRQLSLTAYQRLVMGFLPDQSSHFIETTADELQRSVLAKNTMAGEFSDGVAFASCVSSVSDDWAWSLNRLAFLGPNADTSAPQRFSIAGPLQHSEAITEPCFVQESRFTIPPNGRVAITILLGECGGESAVNEVLKSFSSDAAVIRALNEVTAFWNDTLGSVHVHTPVPAIDVMVNGWLLYQTLACRVWGRTGFYQSSGAFGFRDQLQDSGALVYTRPDLTRQQLLLHASKQFTEGDVLHWWHDAPLNRGLRTRFSDDLNWLPLLTALYVRTTGDTDILNEQVPWLKAQLLEFGQDENYLKPELEGSSSDLYEHCCRALDRSLTKGRNGLPLMGTGDWNDGMNRVGREGEGESVWMGFFLLHILTEFIPYCERRQDAERITAYREYQQHLETALNTAGWDGEWYRRAYYDDGTPLGSASQDECKIDALAQAWAIISKAAPADRAVQAMQATEKLLIDRKGRLIRLLTPAFVNTPHDPGYIKGYVAGVRENGGQYTHAACWVVRAMAEMGRTEEAAALLEMLSPASHARTREEVELYKTEPYVVVADVYGEPPHVGRGGWSWYTGSAGWLYRVALESVLGITLEDNDTFIMQPCIPSTWPGFEVDWKLGECQVRIEVTNGSLGKCVHSATLNGIEQPISHGVARITLSEAKGNFVITVQLS